jgi:hypothetical protein
VFPLSRSPVATIRSAVAAAPSLQLSPLLPIIVYVFVEGIEVRWRIRGRTERRRRLKRKGRRKRRSLKSKGRRKRRRLKRKGRRRKMERSVM